MDETKREILTPMALLQRCADADVNVHQALVLMAMVTLAQEKVVATRQSLCRVLRWKVQRLQRHIKQMRFCRTVPLLKTIGVVIPDGKGQPADIFDLTPMGREKLRALLTGQMRPRKKGTGRPREVDVPAAPQSVVRVEPFRKAEGRRMKDEVGEGSTSNIERPTTKVVGTYGGAGYETGGSDV